MPLDLLNVKKQFEKGFVDYDENAVVQKLMALKLVIELSKYPVKFGKVLELGSGTGLLTQKLINKVNFDNFYANDIVESSKSYVEKFIKDVKFVGGDGSKLDFENEFDLIVSNATFQWFEDLGQALKSCAKYLKPEGLLAFSMFTKGNYREITDLAGVSLDYHTWQGVKELVQRDFEILYCENSIQRMRFLSPLGLLEHMKKTGVNSLSERIWSVKDVKAFCNKCTRNYPFPQLTYTPMVVVAKKKEQK